MVEKIFLVLLIIPVLYLFILLIGKTINTIAESNNAEKSQLVNEGVSTREKSSKQKAKETKATSPKRRRRKKVEEKAPEQEERLNFYEQKSRKSIYAEKNDVGNNQRKPPKK